MCEYRKLSGCILIELYIHAESNYHMFTRHFEQAPFFLIWNHAPDSRETNFPFPTPNLTYGWFEFRNTAWGRAHQSISK